MIRNTKMWTIAMMFTLALGLSACEFSQETSETIPSVSEEEVSDHSSKHLSDEQIGQITDGIRELVLSTYAPEVRRMENFDFEPRNEQVVGDKIILDITLYVDDTTIREPEQTPIILGMKRALAETETKQERALAEKYIEGHLKEIIPYYDKTMRGNFTFRAEASHMDRDDFTYKLYYLEATGDQSVARPAEEYFDEHFREDVAEREEMGYDMLKEQLALYP